MALRRLIALVLLSFWLSPSAGAFCVSDAAYDYVMRGDDSVPEQSLPGFASRAQAPLAAERGLPLQGRIPQTPAIDLPRAGADPGCRAPQVVPGPWRAYCERSCRLLR